MKEEQDYKMKFILQYNVEAKKIFLSQVKLLKIMRLILERIQVGKETVSRATFRLVKEFESDDNKEDIFRRRMSLRTYFKNLEMQF
mmetsp:Transcript_14126/g.10191  ORF Transcript_14126/g.10191 Transcript_14126/m.10191 type:complete len:86 (-) Transcript_14126:142-399(-)